MILVDIYGSSNTENVYREIDRSPLYQIMTIPGCKFLEKECKQNGLLPESGISIVAHTQAGGYRSHMKSEEREVAKVAKATAKAAENGVGDSRGLPSNDAKVSSIVCFTLSETRVPFFPMSLIKPCRKVFSLVGIMACKSALSYSVSCYQPQHVSMYQKLTIRSSALEQLPRDH